MSKCAAKPVGHANPSPQRQNPKKARNPTHFSGQHCLWSIRVRVDGDRWPDDSDWYWDFIASEIRTAPMEFDPQSFEKRAALQMHQPDGPFAAADGDFVTRA